MMHNYCADLCWPNGIDWHSAANLSENSSVIIIEKQPKQAIRERERKDKQNQNVLALV